MVRVGVFRLREMILSWEAIAGLKIVYHTNSFYSSVSPVVY